MYKYNKESFEVARKKTLDVWVKISRSSTPWSTFLSSRYCQLCQFNIDVSNYGRIIKRNSSECCNCPVKNVFDCTCSGIYQLDEFTPIGRTSKELRAIASEIVEMIQDLEEYEPSQYCAVQE